MKKERKICFKCNSNRLLTSYYDGEEQCKQCTLIYKGEVKFGKYDGILLVNVINCDLPYYEWCLKNIQGFKESVEKEKSTYKN
jgi:hypothetical protein